MIDRRQFIKSSVKGTAGSYALAHLPGYLKRQPERLDGKLGVALVGLGNYSTTQLAPALKEAKHCYLAGIVTGTPEKAEKWSKEYDISQSNIYSYENYDEIANNDSIDIIYVVLPNSMHAEYTIRALEAGKHVICEKPMALTAVEARAMLSAAQKAQRKLAVGYRLHYDPFTQEVMRLGQNEAFGRINYMECSVGYSYTPQEDSWTLKKSMGGGSLYNLGVYPIQGARYTKGSEPRYVTAQASIQRKNIFKEVSENFTWQLEWADGSLCNSYSGSTARIDRLWAGCTKGFIELSPAYYYSGLEGRSSEGSMTFEQVWQQQLQMDDFAYCIKHHLPSRVDGMQGLYDALIIDAIHKSIDLKGERVKIESI